MGREYLTLLICILYLSIPGKSWAEVSFIAPDYEVKQEISSYLLNPDTVIFSKPTGMYGGPLALYLSGGDLIRYTLDGKDPDANSVQYSGPISISENTLVKAAVFQNGVAGDIYAQNYLIYVSHSLPVLSLNTDPLLLWDYEVGMYVLGPDHEENNPYFGANFWKDWEYPFYFSYFNANTLEEEGGIGVKIFGGWSRAFDQKSFSLFARSQYGLKNFNYKFFPDRPYSKFEALILRNSGNDWYGSFLRDVVMTSLLKNTQVDFQAYQPVVVYLNGDYWGMYNMREKINEHYLASLHDLDPDEIDLLQNNGDIKHGSNSEFNALKTYIYLNSLESDENYENVLAKIDEVSFIQYQVAQIYYHNTDWPGNNLRYWKSKEGKWRWIIYDTDFGLSLYDNQAYLQNTLAFATETNGPSWPNPPWSTLFLRKLLENDQFKVKFINYFADFMNSIYLPSYANAHVDALADGIRDEVVQHRERWGHWLNGWYEELNKMKTFFNNRPAFMRNFIKAEFNLPSHRRLTLIIDDPGKGKIQVNSLLVGQSEWNGIYFENNPITLTAIPEPGYEFTSWSGDLNSTDINIDINMRLAMTIQANFTAITSAGQELIINEINYNSPDEISSSDWIELFNTSNQAIDLSSWLLKDQNADNTFEIPDETIIEAGQYLVLCRDQVGFSETYPYVENYIGDFDFGFSSAGEVVRLFDNKGLLVDSVSYLPIDPWPEDADGNGPSLELISPELDNSLASNWAAFPGYGTPGRINHSIGAKDKKDIEVFPNPGRGRFTFQSNTPGLKISSVSIFDLTGNFILKEGLPIPAKNTIVDLSNHNSGQYLAIVSFQDHSIEGVFLDKF